MPSYTTTVTTPTGKAICSNHDDMIIEVMYIMAEGMAKEIFFCPLVKNYATAITNEKLQA